MISAQCPKCKKFSESMTYHQCPYCGYRDDQFSLVTALTLFAVFVGILVGALFLIRPAV